MKKHTLIICLALITVLFTNCRKEKNDASSSTPINEFNVQVNHRFELCEHHGQAGNCHIYCWEVVPGANYDCTRIAEIK